MLFPKTWLNTFWGVSSLVVILQLLLREVSSQEGQIPLPILQGSQLIGLSLRSHWVLKVYSHSKGLRVPITFQERPFLLPVPNPIYFFLAKLGTETIFFFPWNFF